MTCDSKINLFSLGTSSRHKLITCTASAVFNAWARWTVARRPMQIYICTKGVIRSLTRRTDNKRVKSIRTNNDLQNTTENIISTTGRTDEDIKARKEKLNKPLPCLSQFGEVPH